MDYRDSPDEHDFRLRLRGWLAEQPFGGTEPRDDESRVAEQIAWHRLLYAAGWLGLSWPVEYGGQGLPATFEAIFNDELAAAGSPPAPHIGFLGRAILSYGTEAQKLRFLPGLLSGEEHWCQGFSEPDAGSDLAALSTRALRTDDRYVVDGQKVWTSDAQFAHWCLLLARTDTTVPKHQGISCLIVDMASPGITVRPLVQITGSAEFNEVFFDGVEVPVEALVGQPGQGWAIAMRTVTYERGPADIGFISRYRAVLERLEAEYRAGRTTDGEDARRRLARAYVDIEALRLRVLRSLSARQRVEPGPEGSIDKLLMTRAEQSLYHVALDVLGAGPVLEGGYEWLYGYLYSRGQSIYGGTEQIQRNIVAQRLLGMPR